MTGKNLDEFARIAGIEAHVGPHGSRTLVGIGDDAAVVRSSGLPLLVCTDAMVESVHFDLWWISARDLGHKALAACLSDIAAMNGRPLHALFSIALPKSAPADFLDEFYDGATSLARELGCDIIGGDLASSPSHIFIDVTCIGESEHPVQRAGARVGDLVAVSGFPGASAAGLYVLQNEIDGYESLEAAHQRPHPRFDLLPGLASSPSLCTSMIDISDGLSSELHHLARRSGVGFEIEEKRIPFAPEALALATKVNKSALEWALSGGEDYELLVTLDSKMVEATGGPPKGFTIIGKAVAPNQGLKLVRADGSTNAIQATGFNHFAT